tara:strand:+ start:335 stop:589 length:255 start_codon:yes stop_codon:yes gene_type:complete
MRIYHTRIPRKLTLGQNYMVAWPCGKDMNCKLIQPTKKGYNLLNLNTNKCIMPNHLYIDKKFLNKKSKHTNVFWINQRLSIEKE